MRRNVVPLVVRGALILFFICIVAVLAYNVAEYRSRYMFIAVLMAVVAMLLSFTNWRRVVPILFAYVCIEGFISNLLYPKMLPLLFKDFVVILIYLGFAGEVVLKKRTLLTRPIFIPLALFTALATVQVFNPGLRNVLVGLVGLKMYVFYLPLILVGYYYFHTLEDLRHFLGYLILLSLPVSLMAYYQYGGGWETIKGLNERGFWRAEIYTAAAEGRMLRVPATFAVSGIFGAYAMVTLLIGAIYWAATPSSRARWIRLVMLLILATSLLLSGSRGALVIAGLALVALSFVRVQQRGAHGFALMIAACVFFSVAMLGSAVQGRLASLKRPEVYISRLEPAYLGTAKALSKNPWGNGTGSATPQARHVRGAGGEPELGEEEEWRLVEKYVLKLAHELGALGLVLFTLVVFAFIWEAKRAFRQLRTPEGKWLGVGVAFFVTLQLLACYVALSLDTPPVNVYAWFFCGVMLRLPELEAASIAADARTAAGFLRAREGGVLLPAEPPHVPMGPRPEGTPPSGLFL